ncbi:hypothetical protein [Futiania mangrovi]|uniref:Uncharacterized protein n=1 Tax=Futiania mangrovi TaxID=2959716 RepID=A0A9J6P7Y7_9PROT|nr:hypothetical protein [Futiania mangrovii]MCP1335476.1 hypothetical protein [Futiania mangrovii]
MKDVSTSAQRQMFKGPTGVPSRAAIRTLLLAGVGAAVLLAGCNVTLGDRKLPEDPYGWHGVGKVVTLVAPGGNAELRRGFSEMARGSTYFGALHLDRESASYAYTRNWNSIEAAISISAAVCTEDAGRPCVLAALVLPEALPSTTRRAKGFSVQTLNQFRLLYAEKQASGLWGAYAISPLASQGFSAQEQTEKAARASALRNCEFRLQAELAQIGPVGSLAAARGGFDRCEIVHVTSP